MRAGSIINNNLSERSIKPFVINRKGWLFADNVAGAQAAPILFSLIETCKYHKVELYNCIRQFNHPLLT
jgi:transposase